MKRTITKLKNGVSFKYYVTYDELKKLRENELFKILPTIMVADLVLKKIKIEAKKWKYIN